MVIFDLNSSKYLVRPPLPEGIEILLSFAIILVRKFMYLNVMKITKKKIIVGPE